MLDVHAHSTPPSVPDDSHPPWPGSKRWRTAFTGGSTRTRFHLSRLMSNPNPPKVQLPGEDTSTVKFGASSLLFKSLHDLTKSPVSTKNKPPPPPLPTSSEPGSLAIEPYDTGYIGGTRMRKSKGTRNLSLTRSELSASNPGIRATYVPLPSPISLQLP